MTIILLMVYEKLSQSLTLEEATVIIYRYLGAGKGVSIIIILLLLYNVVLLHDCNSLRERSNRHRPIATDNAEVTELVRKRKII